MLEVNRLKPMIDNYDPKLFEELYKKTENLRRKLSLEIDHRRFGVDNEEIQCWFTVKFIYVFNKYYNTKRDLLLGYLINAMQLFKYRVIRAAYATKFSQNITEFQTQYHDMGFKDDPYKDTDFYYEELCKYLKIRISDNALLLFQTQLNPPPYIILRLSQRQIHNIHKIPDDLILDYFNLGFTDKNIRYLANLKKEIKLGISYAKDHFDSN